MKPIQLFKPKFRKKEILSEIGECCDLGWTGLGYKTVEFEEQWKKYTDFPYAHFLNSATSGLHLAINILKHVNGWKDKDEIITTPLTFVSTNHPILYENLTPVFCDIDDSLCMDPDDLLNKITRKTKAIIFVGVGGNIGQYNKIKQICDDNDIKLILDAAHMAGTKMTKVFEYGTCQSQVGWDADVSVFSFQAVKNLPTADSGMICFNNRDYDSLARKLAWLGIDKDTFSRTNKKGTYKWEYDVNQLGFKYHGNSVIASMAKIGLKYLDEDNKYRRSLAENYDKLLKNNKKIKVVKHNKDILSSRHLYQIRVKNRDKVMEFLNLHNIYPGVHYKSNTLHQVYQNSKNHCPKAHKYNDEIISLPMHCFLTKKEQKHIVDILKKATI